MLEPTHTGFQPSPAQLAALKTWQDKDYDCTVAEGMLGAERARETWYAWMGLPEFASWWEAEARKHFMRLMPRIYAAMCKAATGKGGLDLSRGAADRKTLLERFDKGFVPRSRQDITGDVGLSLDLTAMTEDELDGLIHAIDPEAAAAMVAQARAELEAKP